MKKLSKLSTMIILAVVIAGTGSAYALVTITLSGNVVVTGNLDVSGNLTGQTISDFDSRITDMENTFLDPTSNCMGTAGCIAGYVTQHIDGDTLKVYGKSIRFALVDAPESNEPGYNDANNFIATTCPLNSFAIVDEDDLQTGGSFGRIIGVVMCNGTNLNEAILDAGFANLTTSFCSSSEFENSAWAQNHGC